MEPRRIKTHNELISLLLTGRELPIILLVRELGDYKYDGIMKILDSWEGRGYITKGDVESRVFGGPKKMVRITDWGRAVLGSVIEVVNRFKNVEITREEREDLFERFANIIERGMRPELANELLFELKELILDKLFEIFAPFIIVPEIDFPLNT